MPARVEDEWSDSDEEYDSSGGVETNVQLGIPDGSITAEEDLKDPRVSRIGGHPVRLAHSPSYGSLYSLHFVLVLRFSLYPLLPMYLFRNAKIVQTPCSSSPRSGVQSRIVLLTARCISGLVPTGNARRRMEGTQTCLCHANCRLMLMKLFNSVRAWRCVRFNKKYAEKLERKAARKKVQEKKVEKTTRPTGPKSNPFSVSARSDIDWYCLTSGL